MRIALLPDRFIYIYIYIYCKKSTLRCISWYTMGLTWKSCISHPHHIVCLTETLVCLLLTAVIIYPSVANTMTVLHVMSLMLQYHKSFNYFLLSIRLRMCNASNRYTITNSRSRRFRRIIRAHVCVFPIKVKIDISRSCFGICKHNIYVSYCNSSQSNVLLETHTLFEMLELYNLLSCWSILQMFSRWTYIAEMVKANI